MTLNPSKDSISLKANLRDALDAHAGDPRHPVVAEIIEQLAILNPTLAPTQESDPD